MPTFLSLAGLSVPDSSQGDNLVPLLADEKKALHEYVYSETVTRGAFISMIRDDTWKCVHYTDSDIGELHNLKEDPYELRNLYSRGAYKEVKEEYLAKLLEWKVKTIGPAHKHLPHRFM